MPGVLDVLGVLDALDLLLPRRCAGCGGAGGRGPGALCAGCTTLLRGLPRSYGPSPAPPGLPRCWSATDYAGVARRVILAYKERGRTALAAPLAACLAGVAEAALRGRTGRVVLVPVPSARAARRARGHDPVGALAARTARLLAARGRPAVAAPVLGQRRRVADQAGLGAASRAANLRGAFRAAGPVPPGLCVLVDDVVTTGATLAEAARALGEAGARPALAITVAATRRREKSGHGYAT